MSPPVLRLLFLKFREDSTSLAPPNQFLTFKIFLHLVAALHVASLPDFFRVHFGLFAEHSAIPGSLQNNLPLCNNGRVSGATRDAVQQRTHKISIAPRLS